MGEVTGRRIRLVLGTSAGGVGGHVRVLAAALVDAGADVRVCGPASTERLFGFAATGADFQPVEIENGIRPAADARAVRLLRPLVADGDIVHAHGLRAGFVATRAAPAATPLVVTWHNAVLARGPKRRLFAAIERRVARRATINLAVSADLVSRIESLGGRARLAPVGATRPRPAQRPAAEVRVELGAGDRPVILAVGRLHGQKGFDTLVAAAVRWRERDPVPLVVIAGDGPERAALQESIANSQAPVRLLGRREDVPELLGAADVVVMPSRWEGSPLAAHEALFAGRPLVVAAVGGLPDLAGDGAALLIRPGDADELADAVAGLLDNPAQAAALGARGLRRAEEWPDALRSAQDAIATYAEMLAGR